MLQLFTAFILCLFALNFNILAQDAEIQSAARRQAAEWLRLKSDNGEFSIEMPAVCSYFYNQDGFIATENSNSYQMKEMQLINCYENRALMSVEIYRTSKQKAAISAMLDFQNYKTGGEKLNIPGFVGKEFKIRNKDWIRTTRYVASKTHLYIISTATREQNNPAFERFLSSVKFNENTNSAAKTILISSLKRTEPEVTYEKPEEKNAQPTKPPIASSGEDPDVTKFAVVGTPRVSYTDAARQSGTTGLIRLRLTFSPEGRVSKVGVLQELPSGLTRQAAIAALRIKYLPQEKNGTPVTIKKVVEFSFNMY